MITRILDYLEQRIRQGLAGNAVWQLPGGGLLVEQKIRDWRSSTENALRQWLGRPVGELPNDLSTLGGARQADDLWTFAVGTGGGSLVGDVLSGVGDIVGKGLLLVVIGGMMFMGAWMLFREPGVVIQLARRAARGVTA